jgi:catechol 2,3-dioxygenase-like lactoylglutathione lyase family enzyme
MTVSGLAHVNIATPHLDETRAFYVDVMGLAEGQRPPFKSRGYWLFAGDRPIVHLVEDLALSPALPVAGINHIAFQTDDVEAFAGRLKAHGIAFEASVVPGTKDSQLIFTDPTGVRLEVTSNG